MIATASDTGIVEAIPRSPRSMRGVIAPTACIHSPTFRAPLDGLNWRVNLPFPALRSVFDAKELQDRQDQDRLSLYGILFVPVEMRHHELFT